MTEISKKAKEMTEENSLTEEQNQAYIDNVGEEYAEASQAEEAFAGEFANDEEFTQDLIEQTGELPKDLPAYIHIDWEGTARDIMMDYFEVDGYYFRNI